jgi:hypothetical protein
MNRESAVNKAAALTPSQVIARSKTVTRRDSWRFAKPGDRLTMCPKVITARRGRCGRGAVRLADSRPAAGMPGATCPHQVDGPAADRRVRLHSLFVGRHRGGSTPDLTSAVRAILTEAHAAAGEAKRGDQCR